MGTLGKVEARNLSDEEVHDAVTKALTLVDELDPPGDLRAAVFASAAELYGAKSVTFVEQYQPGALALPAGLQ